MDEKPQRRRLRFGLRTLFEIIAVVAFILTLIYYRTVATQSPGRYQYYSERGWQYVFDTQTGHLWRVTEDKWFDLGEPPPS